jgi:hypothetical protein
MIGGRTLIATKIAEALILRADLQKKLASLRERITQYVTVQQGEKPAESPTELIKQAMAVARELEDLVYRINRANLHAKLSDGRTLTEALAQRETLVHQHAILTAAVGATRRQPDRYGLKEIKWVVTIDVSKTQKQADDLAKKLRELNVLIQEANWKTTLPE